MDNFTGKVAFISGAASGIGLGMAKAFAAQHMKVALADVREEKLQAATRALRAAGAHCLAVPLDVTRRDLLAAAADQVETALGQVQLLCSNAGVNFVGATQDATFEDWDFCLGVNVGGAVNAIRTFVPRMLAHGAGGHIVITSSMSGLFTRGGSGVYVTSKFALIGLAESLRADLAPHGIGVSALCPGPVKSELFESTIATRPRTLAATGSVPVIPPGVAREDSPIFATAPTSEYVGEQVVRGIRRNDLYIMTHPEMRSVLAARAAALIAALPQESVDPARLRATESSYDAALYLEQCAKPPPH
jgi:NAD(P)-dependent dehydrogenase (short-subunit alcohol dehydrogenase family)